MIALGEKEVQAKTLSVRKRRSKESRTLDFESFIEEVETLIREKTIDCL